MNVRQPFHPAARDHRNIDPARKVHGRVDVDALEQPVAANVGEQQRGDARILESPGEIDHRHVGHLGPAFGRYMAVFRVHRDNDAAFPFARHFAHEFRVLERSRAHHDPRDTKVEPVLDRRRIADAAAQLDVAGKSLDNRLDRLAIAALARETAVKIDHVEVLRACLGKDHRLRRRIVAVNGRAVHVAFGQPYDFAAFEVDCGEDDHGFHSRKRASVAKP